MRKVLNITLVFMQLVFFLSCFTITFIDLDTENSSNGVSMYDHLSDCIHSGNLILSVIMAIGIFAPIIVILMLRFINNKKKYIYSGLLIFVSILSFVNFYSEHKDFLPTAFKLSYSFYTLLISLLVSIMCILGIFKVNIKLKCRNSF